VAAKSPSSKLVDQLITRYVAPGLRSAGFARRGRAFVRSSNDLLHCVHFQPSKWNTPDSASFTGNLLAVWPRWHEIWTGRRFEAAYKAAPIADARVGLLVLGEDTWWQVEPGMPIERLGREVSMVVDRGCELFSDRFRSLDATLALLENGDQLPGAVPQPLIHAAILVDKGRREAAIDRLRHALAARPDWHEGRVVAERLNLASGLAVGWETGER
jgi:hypothetical protein